MATPKKRKGRSLSWVAGIGATVALVATSLTVAPAVAGAHNKATAAPSSVGSVSKANHKANDKAKAATTTTPTTPTSAGSVVTNVKSPATVTLASSVPGNGLVTGEAVSFTATVTTSGAPATGKIIFAVVGSEGSVASCDGGNVQPVSTSGGVTTATCSFANGLPGKPLFYNVSATLVDPNFTAPTATLAQLIDKSLTTTTVKQVPGSVLAGQAFTFNAVVQDTTPGAGSPTGSMEFAVCPYFSPTCAGGPSGAFAMAAPTAWDKAHNENRLKFSVSSGVLTPGFYTVSADYVGDSNYWSSESSFGFLLVTPSADHGQLAQERQPDLRRRPRVHPCRRQGRHACDPVARWTHGYGHLHHHRSLW